MRKIYHCLFVFILTAATFSAGAQQPGLLFSALLPNPNGADDNKEFVELTATQSIDFTVTPYTVVFNDGSNATVANGWKTGLTGSYAIAITTGTVVAGDKIYVGGNAYTINGSSCKKIQKNTTTAGDGGIGSATSGSGMFGNGGGSADGVAVFNMAAAAITNTSVPIDAIFFGTGVGSASNKFLMPTNDHYDNAQGKFGIGTNTFVGPDPGSDEYIIGTGEFNLTTFTWLTARTWTKTTTLPNCNNPSPITLTVPNNLSFTPNTAMTGPYLAAPDISGVISDATDPAASLGIVFTVKDNGVDIPAANYTIAASSSNTGVVANANVTVIKADGLATVKVLPSGAGYTTITLTLDRSGATKTYAINYAASAAGTNSGSGTHYHTSNSDASTAMALDDDYMIVSDDEQNRLIVFNRKNSGLPVKSFDYSGLLNLTDLSAGVPREIDLEASARGIANPNRIFWLGSMSNKSSSAPYSSRPNRNRIFATTVTGTGASTAFTYVGDYENLRSNIISWGDANGFNLSASAADGKDPKEIDGFNAEGMCFAPDNTTMYIAFRAPLLPTSSRTKALIVPILNFETWFGNGSPSAPTFGSPVLLELNGWGIRSIDRLTNGTYVIVAGNYDDGPFNGSIFTWNGNPVDAPVIQPGFIITGMNPESFLQMNSGGNMLTNQLQLISDNGAFVYYNDAVEAKDLGTNNFKKFRSDIVTSPGSPLPVKFTAFDLTVNANNVTLRWTCAGMDDVIAFEVQRAQQGTYAVIGNRVPQGNNYSWNDAGLAPGIYEYRIKAIERNGQVFYTNVRLARIGGSLSKVSVNPNPAINGNIHVVAMEPGAKALKLYNAGGALVYETQFNGNEKVIDKQLPAGFYMLQVKGEGYVETIRVFVK